MISAAPAAAADAAVAQSGPAAAGSGQTLPRRAGLGVSAAPLPPELRARIGADRPGIFAEAVFPGQTAAKLGLAQGDVLLTMNGAPLPAPADFVAQASKLRVGDTVTFTAWRDGRVITLTGPALPRPYETYRGASVRYGATPFQGGLLRDIMVLPEGRPQAPVVFLLQGFTCASIDYPDPETAHRKLTQALVERGIGVYRIEKPGVGDSLGGPRCADTDFDVELAAFQAGYDALTGAYGVNADRVFMLGHSMGGLQAPLLAARKPPRGVAVYGTVLRNWHDYHLDVFRFQSTILGEQDPAESAAEAELIRDTLRRFYFDRRPLAALAAESPERARAMREVMSWDGGENLFGRHQSFSQDLAHLPLIAAWRDTKSRVLAMYGEADFVALNDEDHRLLARIVDSYRPGTARFVEIPGADHGMSQVGSLDDVRRQRRAGAPPSTRPAFDPQVAKVLADWIDQSMASPPVRTLTFPDPFPPQAGEA